MENVCGHLVEGYSLAEAETGARAEEDVKTETEGDASVTGKGEDPFSDMCYLFYMCVYVTGKGETTGETTAEAATSVLEPCIGIYQICCDEVGDLCTCSEDERYE